MKTTLSMSPKSYQLTRSLFKLYLSSHSHEVQSSSGDQGSSGTLSREWIFHTLWPENRNVKWQRLWTLGKRMDCKGIWNVQNCHRHPNHQYIGACSSKVWVIETSKNPEASRFCVRAYCKRPEKSSLPNHINFKRLLHNTPDLDNYLWKGSAPTLKSKDWRNEI